MHAAPSARFRRLAPEAVDALLADESVDFAPPPPRYEHAHPLPAEANDRVLRRLQDHLAQLQKHQRRLSELLR